MSLAYSVTPANVALLNSTNPIKSHRARTFLFINDNDVTTNEYALGMLMINPDNKLILIIRQDGGSLFSCTFCVVFEIITLFY